MYMWATLLLVTQLLSVPPVDYAEVEGIIGPVTAEFIVHAIDRAEQDGAGLLIIGLDTPGGLDPSMRIIVKRIFNARVPICIYVYPPGARAASAGVFITMAAHIAAMAPGTNIGAAHPVAMGQQMDSTMAEKVTNDAVAYIRSIARKRGRNEAWAERAVRESVSLPAKDAVDQGVVDLLADNLEDLLKKLDGRAIAMDGDTITLETKGAEIRRIRMGLRERILSILANPNVAYILLVLGFYGLFFELSNPGAILPGVLGAISLILAFYSFQTLPVNYAGVLLIVLAMILFIAEIKIQSHGMLALGGGVSLLMGSLMLFNTDVPFLRVSWATIAWVLGLTLLFFFVVVAKGIQAQRRKPTTGLEGMIGLKGEAKTRITPQGGTVLVHGELWRAISQTEIPKGARVIVKGYEGMTLFVEPSEPPPSS